MGHVLGRLPHVQTDLGALDVHRVAPEGDDGHLRAVAGTGRGLLEDQGHPLAGQGRGQGGRVDLGQAEQRPLARRA